MSDKRLFVRRFESFVAAVPNDKSAGFFSVWFTNFMLTCELIIGLVADVMVLPGTVLQSHVGCYVARFCMNFVFAVVLLEVFNISVASAAPFLGITPFRLSIMFTLRNVRA